jgi:hypothetical protein
VGFILTDLTWWSKNSGRFYYQPDTSEQWIKEGKNAMKWPRMGRKPAIDTRDAGFALS